MSTFLRVTVGVKSESEISLIKWGGPEARRAERVTESFAGIAIRSINYGT